jgi:hypothetical protein
MHTACSKSPRQWLCDDLRAHLNWFAATVLITCIHLVTTPTAAPFMGDPFHNGRRDLCREREACSRNDDTKWMCRRAFPSRIAYIDQERASNCSYVSLWDGLDRKYMIKKDIP